MKSAQNWLQNKAPFEITEGEGIKMLVTERFIKKVQLDALQYAIGNDGNVMLTIKKAGLLEKDIERLERSIKRKEQNENTV
jgi:hypothetical protein